MKVLIILSFVVRAVVCARISVDGRKLTCPSLVGQNVKYDFNNVILKFLGVWNVVEIYSHSKHEFHDDICSGLEITEVDEVR